MTRRCIAMRFAKLGVHPFTSRVQFELNFFRRKPRVPEAAWLAVGERTVPLIFVRHPRARRYVLRLRADGSAQVTIPRGGSLAAAHEFAGRHLIWLERQFQRLAQRPASPVAWSVGSELLLRGEKVRIEAEPGAGLEWIQFGTEKLRIANQANSVNTMVEQAAAPHPASGHPLPIRWGEGEGRPRVLQAAIRASYQTGDLRPSIERHLRQLATRELPPRLLELAAQHELNVQRVSVRNQRSRWGSCSRRGTISLNWRLIQTPPFVRDYILLHELMHLRQMNHSARFWREVERACPDYPTAERWLKDHRQILRPG